MPLMTILKLKPNQPLFVKKFLGEPALASPDYTDFKMITEIFNFFRTFKKMN
jgi:hypothetical protein